MRSTSDDTSKRRTPRAERHRASNALAAHLGRCGVAASRRWARDERGSASIEYLLVTTVCGLLVATGLIATLGPSLVSTWSDRRACLYDGVCLSPPQP
jgi:Flp pilus assembly pilin Flp